MPKIIVGIHGLANKPEKDVLAEWWVKSIREGLAKNCVIIPLTYVVPIPIYKVSEVYYGKNVHGFRLL